MTIDRNALPPDLAQKYAGRTFPAAYPQLVDDLLRKLAEAQQVIATLRQHLSDPPPDVQEAVMRKLDLVSRDALIDAEKHIQFLKHHNRIEEG